MKIERHRDARRLNQIVNDPAVYPMVNGAHEGPIDLSGIVERDDVLLLVGEQGALVFTALSLGLWDCHSQCLPEGRGSWMLEFTQLALQWLFTRTDALELLTRCPEGNVAASALARRVGMRPDFPLPRGWVRDGKEIPATAYSMTVQDWIRTAPELEERGAWVRARLAHEMKRDRSRELDDPGYERHLGAAFEMIFGGQAEKGCVFFDRFAFLAGHDLLRVVEHDPLTIDVGGALLVINEGDFWVASYSKAA